jgi:ketosteroid isomerase-like protein
MPVLTDADRARLRQMVEQDWVQAALERDADASVALCADDVVYMPQDHPVVHGKDEMRVFLGAFPRMLSFTQSVEELSGDTALAVTRGSFEITLDLEGREVSGKGKYLATSAKRSGQWLMTSACFNWDAPLGATG